MLQNWKVLKFLPFFPLDSIQHATVISKFSFPLSPQPCGFPQLWLFLVQNHRPDSHKELLSPSTTRPHRASDLPTGIQKPLQAHPPASSRFLSLTVVSLKVTNPKHMATLPCKPCCCAQALHSINSFASKNSLPRHHTASTVLPKCPVKF